MDKRSAREGASGPVGLAAIYGLAAVARMGCRTYGMLEFDRRRLGAAARVAMHQILLRKPRSRQLSAVLRNQAHTQSARRALT